MQFSLIGFGPNKSQKKTFPFKRASRVSRVCAFAALVVFLALAIGYSLTRGPWWDEGLFADVALHFKRYGRLGSAVLAPHTYLDLPDIAQYTYWQFPLYLASLGIWFYLSPETVQSMRLFSVFWSCVYLFSWFLFTRALSGSETLALLVSSLVAFDYSVLSAASNGRMEMMCAALGQAALAAYVCLRSKNRRLALFVAGTLGTASLLCHPMGAVTSACLAALILTDWRRMSFSEILALAIPYLTGAAICLAYILQAPGIFLAQAKAASSYRLSGPAVVFRSVFNDFYTRYFTFYFGHLSGAARLKGFALLFGIAGILVLAFRKSLRSTPLAKALLLLSGIAYLTVAAIDDMKFPYYLVYVTPFFTAAGAVWVYSTFRKQRMQGAIAVALLGASLTATVTGFGWNIYRNDLVHVYQPAVASVERARRPGGIVMGPAQLGFALGFGPALIDDCFLGYVSHIRPQIYVMHEICGPPRGPDISSWRWSRATLVRDYHPVFTNTAYSVYVRNKP